jgi:hypothetical protein
MLGTVFSKKRLTEAIEMPVAESFDTTPTPAWLDTWRPWLVATIVLLIISYGPILIIMLLNFKNEFPWIQGVVKLTGCIVKKRTRCNFINLSFWRFRKCGNLF